MTRRFKHDLVVVDWEDAVFDSDDSDESEGLRPAVITACGFLLEDNDNYLTLSMECEDGNSWVRRRLTVVKGNVRSVFLIKKGTGDVSNRRKTKSAAGPRRLKGDGLRLPAKPEADGPPSSHGSLSPPGDCGAGRPHSGVKEFVGKVRGDG